MEINERLFEVSKDKKRPKAKSHQSTADFLASGGKITQIKQGVTGYRPNMDNKSQKRGGGSNKRTNQ